MYLIDPPLGITADSRVTRISELSEQEITVVIEKQSGVFHRVGDKVGLERMLKHNNHWNVQIGRYKDGQTSLLIESSYPVK